MKEAVNLVIAVPVCGLSFVLSSEVLSDFNMDSVAAHLVVFRTRQRVCGAPKNDNRSSYQSLVVQSYAYL